MRGFVLIFGLILTIAGSAAGTTYVVRPDGTGDYPTIQAAIDSAAVGDIIELSDGVFTGIGNYDITYRGKAVTVRSQSGNPYDCVINCEAGPGIPRRCFHFHFGEGPASILEGVGITGGYWAGGGGAGGGGVRCETSPTIRNCVFFDNIATSSEGGGMYIDGGAPVVSGCVFFGNTAPHGGGISVCYAFPGPLIERCTFYGNSADNDGGGVRFWVAGGALVECTFYGNAAVNGGGVSGGNSVEMINTIVAFSTQGTGVNGAPLLTCCDIFGNSGGDWVGLIADQYGLNGNVCADPLFCDAQNADFTLQAVSPCAPFSEPNPECDLLGAWPVGCGGTPVMQTSWGAIKAMFRE